VDVLVAKTIRAAKEHKVKTLLFGGGVAANTQLRERLKKEAEELDIKIFIPSVNLCTDNAIYIATTAYFNQVERDLGDINPDPSLGIMD